MGKYQIYCVYHLMVTYENITSIKKQRDKRITATILNFYYNRVKLMFFLDRSNNKGLYRNKI